MSKVKEVYQYIRHTPKGVLVLAIFMLGFILRGPTSVFAPIANQLQSEFGVDLATIGWLSGIPVFCYAAFSPVASFLISKRSLEFTVITCICFCTFGSFIRCFGDYTVMLISSVIIGAAVALGNISIPLIAARDFPKKFAFVTGLSSATMNLGVVFAVSLTEPLSKVLGWRLALSLWVLVCLIVLAIWVAYIFRKRRGRSRKSLKKLLRKASAMDASVLLSTPPKGRKNDDKSGDLAEHAIQDRPLYKQAFTYGICLLFICQCFAFFSLAAWLPSIFVDRGMDATTAGFVSSIFTLIGLVGSISIAPIIKKLGFVGCFALVGLCWISLPFGLLFLGALWPLWMILSGFAQSANYILMFTVITSYSKTPTETRKLSALVQMSAYFIAGIAPTVFGIINQASGNWNVPLLVILIVIALMILSGLLSYRKIPRKKV